MNKKKIVIGVILFLIIGLMVANWYIGNMAERKLEDRITKEMKEADASFKLEYDDLKVNPILAKVTYNNLVLSDEEGTVYIYADKLTTKLSYSDLVELGRAGELKELHTLDINLSNLNLEVYEDMVYAIDFEDIDLNFEGLIPLQHLEKEAQVFSDEKQQLSLAVNGLKLDLPIAFKEMLGSSELEQKFTEVDEISFDISYNPDKKEISVQNYKIDSPLVVANVSEVFHYSGDRLENLTIKDLSGEGDFEFRGNGMQFGEASTVGRYTLGNIKSSSEFNNNLNQRIMKEAPQDIKTAWVESWKNLGEGKADFKLEGFKVELDGQLKERLSYHPLVLMTGIDISEIALDNWEISYSIEDNNMDIDKWKLDSSIIDLDISGDLNINKDNIKLSQINDLEVRIGDLTPNMKMILKRFEMRLGQEFPSDGEDILLELSGPLGKPNIKGLDI
ncbi:hypothetical protein [Orenia marismortui]|uniref:hypothetical protein n=1 Tax=Orenia marismortui TaxID=46469 RepID=UPI00037111F2|nr:hypothetical protein [Orenia marismortui]